MCAPIQKRTISALNNQEMPQLSTSKHAAARQYIPTTGMGLSITGSLCILTHSDIKKRDFQASKRRHLSSSPAPSAASRTTASSRHQRDTRRRRRWRPRSLRQRRGCSCSCTCASRPPSLPTAGSGLDRGRADPPPAAELW
jgi:hypothetical protein